MQRKAQSANVGKTLRRSITTTTEVYVLVLVLVNLTSGSFELGEWCGMVSTVARKEVRL
jgi:hypothetical protein